MLIHGASGYVASVLILMLASEHIMAPWHHLAAKRRTLGKLSGFLLMLYVPYMYARLFVCCLLVACVLRSIIVLFMLDSIARLDVCVALDLS